ncbi:hypothetical protein MCOR27_004910 [Pyricularia oryzae]|uniref:Uncharacterized protein n=2 Tax=Pyricularia TaxID=48558 RepID=A0ABQ8ND59_PYRGI|nr:hypothetical protein MCOR02_001605 [Pyricularia oryzae]KAI6295151.1 hypothetical protein MCOR33_007878 [Pyricularia grisea]KAI6279931.1 hypothetical protein MCOR27_004910 [Pyricularia oryzae]KAI6333566.1 hypothetical protein MCOR30_004233 [Pyricularia oryzae]KAI6339013.1 hypothetical protein MCOR28_007545 [Pyricularia oryzae]
MLRPTDLNGCALMSDFVLIGVHGTTQRVWQCGAPRRILTGFFPLCYLLESAAATFFQRLFVYSVAPAKSPMISSHFSQGSAPFWNPAYFRASQIPNMERKRHANAG